jgi:hypothetical protein
MLDILCVLFVLIRNLLLLFERKLPLLLIDPPQEHLYSNKRKATYKAKNILKKEIQCLNIKLTIILTAIKIGNARAVELLADSRNDPSAGTRCYPHGNSEWACCCRCDATDE